MKFKPIKIQENQTNFEDQLNFEENRENSELKQEIFEEIQAIFEKIKAFLRKIIRFLNAIFVQLFKLCYKNMGTFVKIVLNHG